MPKKTEVPASGTGAVNERRDIEVITAEIQFYKKQAGESILEIGKRLNEAKEQLEHGEWLGWLETKVEFSDATAQRFMRLAREFTNPSPVTDFGSTKALILLALPPAERDAFVEETHVVNGEEKPVFDMSKRELEKAVRERAEALKAKEAAEAAEAEARRSAEAHAKRLAEVDEHAIKIADELRLLKAEKAKMENELTVLRNAEITLPPEEGQQTIEAMRKEVAAEAKKEAEEKLKKKIDKATECKADAEGKLEAAVAERDRIKQESARKEAEAAEKIEKLQKKLAVSGSEHMTIFKTHFESAQSCINSMIGCLLKLKGEPETRDKLAAALRALCDKTVQSLPATKKEDIPA